MKRGLLSEYFLGVAVKRLSAVEAGPEFSHQHEFNGTASMRQILGEERRSIPARVLYLTDEEEERVCAEVTLTWYQARKPPRTEYRFYFPSTIVSERFREGDLLVVGSRLDGSVLLVAAARGTTVERQLLWLFGATVSGTDFVSVSISGGDDARIGHVASLILDELGIDAELEAPPDLLGRLLNRFGGSFPSTDAFSAFARETLASAAAREDPDTTIEAWMDQEERLFRTLERHLVADRLKAGFGASGEDVDGFMEFSLSVHNRRKSRAGRALENHLASIFDACDVAYSRGEITEGKSRPDFVFPGIDEYRDVSFPAARLFMLGAKSSLKDRWRQVLTEADRIGTKHLFTLEPAISEDQTDEMKSRALRLVVPRRLHASFTADQQRWLVDLRGFIGLVNPTP
jgi:hypothetical protein